MKTLDEIYQELQNADNNELNIAWQEAKKENEKTKRITVIVCIIINIILIVLFSQNGLNFKSPMFIIPLLVPVLIINLFVFIIINILFSKNKNKYNAKYKQFVIPKLISNFYNNVEYFLLKSMPEYIYEVPEYESYNIYESDDYFEAQIDNKYSIQMAEVLTQTEEEYEDSDGESHTRTITKFHGLFAKIVMDKSIKSELRIMQNGGFIQKNRLKMDSSEFEKYFDVKASDPIVGMQLLTADVMEELVQFENKTKIKFDIFINGNELYLRFHSGEMFEPANFKKGVLDKNTIQKYFYMLNFTYNLSKRLITIVNDTQI